jgi:hypothetical protein
MDVPAGQVFALEAGTGRYPGRQARADGTPWPRVVVQANPWGSSGLARVSTLTDANGAFELSGLAEAEYRLLFTTDADGSPWSEHGNELAGTSFLPRDPPRAAGTWLAIRIAEPSDLLHLRGTVESASGGPLADVRLSFDCLLPGADGSVRLGGQRAFTSVDSTGAFDVRLPRTPELTVRVYAPAGTGTPGPLLTQVLASDHDDEALHLVVP